MKVPIASLSFMTMLSVSLSAQRQIELAAPVQLTADGEVIDMIADIGHAGPLMIDYDGDGKLDLLVSAFRGSIHHFRNVGTIDAPEWEQQEPLRAGDDPIRIHNW